MVPFSSKRKADEISKDDECARRSHVNELELAISDIENEITTYEYILTQDFLSSTQRDTINSDLSIKRNKLKELESEEKRSKYSKKRTGSRTSVGHR